MVNGIPWAWTWKELKDLLAETGNIERADVVFGRDGRRCGLQPSMQAPPVPRRLPRELPPCFPRCPRASTPVVPAHLHPSLLRPASACAPPPPLPSHGRSRGYGTVRYETPEEATAAIEQFNGYELEGRTLSVRLDKYA